jgi:hypothetical protein
MSITNINITGEKIENGDNLRDLLENSPKYIIRLKDNRHSFTNEKY